jgi:WD40 repeat protein
LDGHTRPVSCIKVSSDGAYIASGQSNFVGVKADVIVWDFAEAKRCIEHGQVMAGEQCFIRRLKQHLSLVQDLSFSCNNDYLCTLGGQDDNALVVWRIDTGEALCGSPAGADSTLCCAFLNGRNDRIVTGGYYSCKVWQIDFSLPKLSAMDVKMGTLRRVFQSVSIDDNDQFGYFGTMTGDVVKVKIDRNDISSPNDPDTVCPTMVALSKERFTKGVQVVRCVLNKKSGNTNVLVGAGDGTITYLNPTMNVVKSCKANVTGSVTSISMNNSGNIIVGTNLCNKYTMNADLTGSELIMSCHCGPINDVAFPDGCPDLVVTSSTGDIRIWNVRVRQELLRIQVPNLTCSCCSVTPTGSALVSGWDDGRIRAFYPETGRMKFVIPDAHAENVTAIAICDSDAISPWRVISGGAEGKVRIWNVSSSHQSLVASLKEHRGAVNCIKVNKDSTQCISASSDGSCIVWDLERYVRITAFFDATIFKSVVYHPDESQMITCGSNHKITYWDAVDGQAIRVIEGGNDVMRNLDIDAEGEFFISCGQDSLVKVWHYDDGIPAATGRGHSGAISAAKLSPDQSQIVTVGEHGEIIFWDLPPLDRLRDKIDEIMGGHK